MGDSDPKTKPGVPSWQLKPKETTPTEGDAESSGSQSERPSRETVVGQAKKFLEEDEVCDASTDKKIAFLEGKGLTGAEIQELLGVTRNTEASATATSTPPTSPEPHSQVQSPLKTQTSPTQSSTQPQTRSTPPIITYPEFLTTPPHPTPLVTKSRLLTTLYIFSGLSALLYGTNTYLIAPMLEQLTTSRLSLAESASDNLQTLVRRLEELVSEIPPSGKGVVGLEEESEDEDPSEMFHRDIGVQTSLPSSPHASRPSSPSPTSELDGQATQLSALSTSLKGLMEDSTSEGQDVSDLSTTVGVLREYLDGLAYVAPSYGYGVGGYNGLMGAAGKEDDEISRVKSSIRGVKGVLLSARSFPGVGRVK